MESSTPSIYQSDLTGYCVIRWQTRLSTHLGLIYYSWVELNYCLAFCYQKSILGTNLAIVVCLTQTGLIGCTGLQGQDANVIHYLEIPDG